MCSIDIHRSTEAPCFDIPMNSKVDNAARDGAVLRLTLRAGSIRIYATCNQYAFIPHQVGYTLDTNELDRYE